MPHKFKLTLAGRGPDGPRTEIVEAESHFDDGDSYVFLDQGIQVLRIPKPKVRRIDLEEREAS